MSSPRSVAVMLEDAALRDTAMSVLRAMDYQPSPPTPPARWPPFRPEFWRWWKWGPPVSIQGALARVATAVTCAPAARWSQSSIQARCRWPAQAVNAGATSIISKPYDAGSLRQRMLLVQRSRSETTDLEVLLAALPAVRVLDEPGPGGLLRPTTPETALDGRWNVGSIEELPAALREPVERARALVARPTPPRWSMRCSPLHRPPSRHPPGSRARGGGGGQRTERRR